jgi:hypothetical protein
MHTIDAHALVIGVSGYSFVRPLPRTYDAEDVAAFLGDPAQGAYPPAHVHTLVEGEATKANVLEGLAVLAKRASEESTVFVYFSGHGGRATEGVGGECYLLPVEAKAASDELLASTALSSGELGASLRAIRAARLTVVLDCCRAAGAADVKDFEPVEVDGQLPERALSALGRGRGRVVMAASRSDGYAFVRPGERHGVFTRHLLDALKGGAIRAGGVVRVCDVFHYVQQKVRAEAPEQRPVFKAEIEDNYPLALYHGGVAPKLEVPSTNDGFRYDAFVSYRRGASDQVWVEKQLVPQLEALGLKICFERRDFTLGAPRLREMERAVIESRYTLAVFSRSYLAGAFQDFEALLAQHQSIETRALRFIPLMREACVPNLSIRTTEWLDVSDDAELDANVARLALRLREPPHPTLTG